MNKQENMEVAEIRPIFTLKSPSYCECWPYPKVNIKHDIFYDYKKYVKVKTFCDCVFVYQDVCDLTNAHF